MSQKIIHEFYADLDSYPIALPLGIDLRVVETQVSSEVTGSIETLRFKHLIMVGG
jgi:hypothetical protein